MLLGGSMSAGTGFKDDLIIPLYQIDIKDSRGNTKKAGPIWIIRYHDCRFNNSTLIITYFRRWCDGRNYVPIFSRPDGDKILKSLINICLRKQLPGEKKPSYYTKKLTLKSNSVELEKLYVDVIHRITKLQQTALYDGKKGFVESWLKRKSKLEATMNDLQNLKWKLLNKESTEKQFANALKKTNRFTSKLKQIAGKLPAEKGEYPPTTFYFSIQEGNPDFVLFSKTLEIAKEVGINQISPGYYGFFIDYLYKTYGTKFYGSFGTGGHHRGPCRIPCAIFDPRTKKNKENAVKRNWLYDEELYKKMMGWANDNLDKLKGKEWLGMLHLPNEMHIRFNQGWGERGMMLFRKYLKEQYGAIDKVNEIWQTNYKNFSEVTVPIKAPKTQKDHAYFDDWTNFRDNLFNRYAKDLYTMAKKKLPEMPVVSRYMGMNVQATRGNNYSILNEYCDLNGSHSYWYGNLYTGDWLHRIGRKPFYNTEYVFHKYNKTGQMNYIKWLCRDLWHGISNGQIGFQFYPWYWTHVPRFESYAFLESDGTPRMVVWELQNFIKKSGIWSDIVKQGKSMEKAQVAFLWSDTSRRHQINTLGIPSPVFKNAEGLNALFRNIHTEREILTEPEVQKGEIPSCTKLIIIPGSVYFEKATYKKLEEFVKKGGWLFVIGDKGAYYDNRGKKDFTFYNIASIVPINIPSPRFLEYNGKTITDFGNLSKWYGWKDIGKQMEILASTAEDYPVIVKVKKGKGGIILSSYPLGNIYLVLTNCGLITKPFPESAIIFQGIMKDILGSLNIQETAEASSLIEVHPWYYKKGEYLLITNLQLYKEGAFSIKLPYAVKSIYDVINNAKVPVKAEDGKTLFDVYLGKGDGMVLEVKK